MSKKNDKNPTSRTIVNLFLAILLIITLSSFGVLRQVFITDTDATLVLSGFLLGIFAYSFKQKEFLQTSVQQLKGQLNTHNVIGIFIVLTCFSLLVFYSFSAILLRMPILFADEWHVYYRILFSENMSEIIFSRYNHHPNYLLNLLYVFNFFFLECNELWFLVLNVGAILTVGFIYFKIIRDNTKNRLSNTNSWILASVASLFSFWILGGNNVFWNMAYVPVMGAIISIYGLSIQNSNGNRKGLVLFFVGALITSCSFSTGAVLWPLALFASFLLSQSIKKLLAFSVLGIVGSVITSGILSLSDGTTRIPELDTGVKAMLIYLGKVFTLILANPIPSNGLPQNELILGTIGILIFITLLVLLKVRPNKDQDPLILFASLLGLFSIGTGLLIILGRMKNDFSIMLSGRYTNWSALFWVSILLLIMAFMGRMKNRSTRNRSILFISLTSLIFLFLNNSAMVYSRLISYNIAIRAKADLIVNPDALGNERLIWQSNNKSPSIRNKVLKVNQRLQQEGLNAYRSPFVQKIGSRISTSQIATGSYDANLNIGNDSIGNFFIEGYVRKTEAFFSAPQGLIFTQDRVVVGIGLPYSDVLVGEKVRTSINMLGEILSAPFINFPGASNYYYGQLVLKDSQSELPVEAFAYLRNGDLIKVNI